MTEEQKILIESAMRKFGEAHILLSKSKLDKKEYNPISNLLSEAKVDLFNFYWNEKNKPQP